MISAAEALGMGRVDIHRVGLLMNPAAAKGGAMKAAQIARRKLRDLGVQVIRFEANSVAASLRAAQMMVADDSLNALVVCGGDGLINLALQAQAGSSKPLGIIPAGTGNDHAREYRIPFDPAQAAQVIAQGFFIRPDLGFFEGGQRNWFGTIACVGLDSMVTARTNRISWPTGSARYILALGIELLRLKPFECQVWADGQLVFDGKMIVCAAGNTRTYGGGMKICPRAKHYDGLLDLTIIENLPRPVLLRKFPRIFTDTLLEIQGVRSFRARQFRVEMQPDVDVYADGDLVGQLPAVLEARPGQGCYLVPLP